MAEKILPQILNIDAQYKEELIYAFARYNATYKNSDVVKIILNDKKYKISFVNKVKITIRNIYGGIRPFIRKVYYKLFLKVRTQ